MFRCWLCWWSNNGYDRIKMSNHKSNRNPKQIERWNSNELPIYEPRLNEVIKSCRGRNLFFTSDVTQAIIDANMIFVSVNTPTKKVQSLSFLIFLEFSIITAHK